MFLFIHAAQIDDTYLFLVSGEGKILIRKKITFKETGEKNILPTIDVILKSKKIKLAKLRGVCILTGPGRFSFLRTGITTANMFGFCLQIPVVGIFQDEFSSKEEFIAKGLSFLKKKKRFESVMPEYGKEPNITRPVNKLAG